MKLCKDCKHVVYTSPREHIGKLQDIRCRLKIVHTCMVTGVKTHVKCVDHRNNDHHIHGCGKDAKLFEAKRK